MHQDEAQRKNKKMEDRTRRGEADHVEEVAAAVLNKRATMCVFGCLLGLGCRSNVIRRLAFYPPHPGYTFGPQGELFLFDGSAAHSSCSSQQQQQQKEGGSPQQQRKEGGGQQQKDGSQPRQQRQVQEQVLVQQQTHGTDSLSIPPADIINPAQQQELLTPAAAVAAAVVVPQSPGRGCSACSREQEDQQQQQQQRGAGKAAEPGAAGAAEGKDEGVVARGEQQQQQPQERESMQQLLRRAGLPEQVEVLKIRRKRRGLRARREDYIAAIFLYLPWTGGGGTRSSFSSSSQQGSPSAASFRQRTRSPAAPPRDTAGDAAAAGAAAQGSAAAAARPSAAAEDCAGAATRKKDGKGSKSRSLLVSAKGEEQQQQTPRKDEAAAAEKKPMLESARRRPCIIFSHGNSTDIGYMFPLYYRLVYKCRVNVLAYDYRGYGRSTGQTSEQSLYKDIQLVWQYATQVLRIPPLHIILYGHSLGSAPSCDLALQETTFPVGGIILHSSISSGLRLFIDDLEKSPWFDAFPNVEKLRKVYQTPILIMHGKLDRQIFWTHSQRLELAAREADETVRRAKEQQQLQELSNGKKKKKNSSAASAAGAAATSRSRSAAPTATSDHLEELRPLRVQTWWVATADHNDVEQKTGDLYYQRIDEFVRFCRMWTAARQLDSVNH